MASDRCLHGLDVLSAIEIDVNEVAFAEVVVAMLDQVVLGQATLEAQALLPVQLVVDNRRDLQRALAEGYCVAQSLRKLALLQKLIELLLICDFLYHYFFPLYY